MAEQDPRLNKTHIRVAAATASLVLTAAAANMFPSLFKTEEDTPTGDPQPAVAATAGRAALNCLESPDDHITLTVNPGQTRATTVATPHSENPTKVVAQEHGNEDVGQVQVRAAGNITPYSGVRDDGEQARWIAPGTYVAAVFGENITITVGCSESSALAGAAEELDKQLQAAADATD